MVLLLLFLLFMDSFLYFFIVSVNCCYLVRYNGFCCCFFPDIYCYISLDCQLRTGMTSFMSFIDSFNTVTFAWLNLFNLQVVIAIMFSIKLI